MIYWNVVDTKELRFFESIQSLREMYGVMKQEHFIPPDQDGKADENSTILLLFNEKLNHFLEASQALFHTNEHVTAHIWALIKINQHTKETSKVALQAMTVAKQAHLQLQYRKMSEISEAMNRCTDEVKGRIRLDQWIESINIYIDQRINDEDIDDQINRLLSMFAEELPGWITQSKQLPSEGLPLFKKQFEILFQKLAQRIKGPAAQNLMDHYKALEEVDRFFKDSEEDSLAKKMRVLTARLTFHQSKILSSKALKVLNDALEDILSELKKKPENGSRLMEIRDALQQKISQLDNYADLNEQRQAFKDKLARLNQYVGPPVLRLKNSPRITPVLDPSGIPKLYHELMEFSLAYQKFHLLSNEDKALAINSLNDMLKKVMSTSMSDFQLLDSRMKSLIFPALEHLDIALKQGFSITNPTFNQTCETTHLYINSLNSLTWRNPSAATPLQVNLFAFIADLFKMSYLPIICSGIKIFQEPRNETESLTYCKIFDNYSFYLQQLASIDVAIFNQVDLTIKFTLHLLARDILQDLRNSPQAPDTIWKEKREHFRGIFERFVKYFESPSNKVENELDKMKIDLERVLRQGINPYPAIIYRLNQFKQTFSIQSADDWIKLTEPFKPKFAAIYHLLSPIHTNLMEFIKDQAISVDDVSIPDFLSQWSVIEEAKKRLNIEEGPLSQIRTLLRSSSYSAVNHLLNQAKVGGLDGFRSWLQKSEEERKQLSGVIQELKEMLAPYSQLDAPHDGKEVSEFLYNCAFIRTMSQTCEGKIEFQPRCLKLIRDMNELSKIVKEGNLDGKFNILVSGIKNVIGCFYDREFTELEEIITQLPPEWKAILCKHLDCITKDLFLLRPSHRTEVNFIKEYIAIFSKIVKKENPR